MKRAMCLFLTVICLFCLAACTMGDAPYTEIPENKGEFELERNDIDGEIPTASFEEYSQTSELAVECEYVGPIEYMRLETKGEQMNFTLNKFRVISVLRGELQSSEIIVRMDGGTVYLKDKRCIEENFEWTPRFQEGERCIMFLNKGSRLDYFCIDSEYYCTQNKLFYFDKEMNKYRSLAGRDTLTLTPDASAEYADNYCFTAAELKDLLDNIAAPVPPTNEQSRIDYIIALEKKKLENGEITEKQYEQTVENCKIHKYSRIVARHKV